MPFDPTQDDIAITLPCFKLLKHADGLLQRYCEPYIVSMAVDAGGRVDPRMDFNFMTFPKVARGGIVRMLGDGHLVYGPRNPGEFVAISVLVMEKDQDMVDLGTTLLSVVQSRAVEMGLHSVLTAHPGYSAVVGVLKELTRLVAGSLKENKDDELFRTEGSFLRGHAVPYHINRSYEVGNDFVRLNLDVVPLERHNLQGPAPTQIDLSP
jgi:hypothetical protein